MLDRLFWLGLLLAGFTCSSGFAQTSPWLISDAEWPTTPLRAQPDPSNARAGNPDTLSISASQDFFDDFAYPERKPDSALWYDPESAFRAIPHLSRQAAIAAPSRGTLVFDGLNAQGTPYETLALLSGKADLLLSHYIDLAPYSPSDQVFLSFQLQAGGHAEPPESNDSFFVYFLIPNDTFRVYAQAGGSAQQGFKQVILPLDNPAWFVTEFQLAFENLGSLNGHLDVWHLDYVQLGLNRNPADTSFQDFSPVRLIGSPLSPFTAIPLPHVQSKARMQGFELSVSNLDNNSATPLVAAEIDDPVGNTPFQPVFSRQKNFALPPYAQRTDSISAFSEQPFSKLATVSLKVQLPGNVDERPGNDTFTENFPIDSLFAYDDGEADRGFGISKAVGFGQRFDLVQTDSISAVWIHFTPTVNFNPVTTKTTYMEGRSFRLRIWFFPHPDSILYEQIGGMKISYTQGFDQFVRYPLSNPVPVPKTFWLGVQQVDARPVGVGFDASSPINGFAYWDSSGIWQTIPLQGAMMIRPEMFNTAPILANIGSVDQPGFFPEIYPNPVQGSRVRVHGLAHPSILRYRANMRDLQGRLCFQSNWEAIGANKQTFMIPASLAPGLYIWEHQILLKNGQTYRHVEKLWLSAF